MPIQTLKNICLTLATLILLGCPQQPEQKALTTFRVGTEFSERVVKLQTASDSTVWIMREHLDLRKTTRDNHTIEKYDVAGQRLLTISEPQNTTFKSFAVHPSGEITIAEIRLINDDWGGKSYHIWLRRLDAQGNVLREVPMRDAVSDRDKQCYYLIDGTTQFVIEPYRHVIDEGDMFRVCLHGHANLIATGESCYFFAWTFGAKIYRLSSQLDIEWSRLIMPKNCFMTDYAYSEMLAVDDQGSIFVSYPLNKQTVAVWEYHFNQKMNWTGGFSSVLVTGFSNSGDPLGVRLFGYKNERIFAQGLHVEKGIIKLGCASRLAAHPEIPNNTSDWRIVYLKADFLSGNISISKAISIEREDLVENFKVNRRGHGVFVGTTDFVQVDTDSWVEFGKGFILTLDDEGERIAYAPVKGPRHTKISTFDFMQQADGKEVIAFAGSTNGPITHTGDQDKSLTFKEGLLGFYR